MITLMELVKATAWTQPQEHMKVSIWNKSKIYEKDEFEDITLTVKTLAEYGDCPISDIDVETDKDGYLWLSCLIER